LLVFGDSLGDFALVQQLLRGFDVLTLVIGHTRTETSLPLERAPGVLLILLRRLNEPQRYLVTLTGRKKPSQ
jgi:hypothetical protein